MRRDSWSELDLVRRLCDALDVAKNTVERLACEGFTDTQEPANSVRPEKVISESGLLLLAASTANRHLEVGKRLRELAECLMPHARSQRILFGICTEPASAWDYALAHVCLTRVGYPDARFDSVLELISSEATPGRERPPHRALEQLWVARGFHLCRHHEDQALRRRALAVMRLTALCQPMDVLSGGREDVYAFTHSLMYATDFRLMPWVLVRQRKTILTHAEAALARSLDDQDYDLAGEVLLAWPLIGRSWWPSSAFGFRVLASVEDRAGFLPSASTRVDRLNTLQGAERARYLLATAYHTAYVMGLLCAMALQPGRTPPTAAGTRSAARGVSKQLLTELDIGPRPHWREQFEQLSAAECSGLDRLLLTVALRRCVVQRDFGRLQAILQIGHAAGLTDTPAASQAAELLARLPALLEVSPGAHVSA